MSRKTRFSTLRRSLQLLRYLMDHRFGVDLEDLMEELDVSRRATYRYISVLNAVGVRVVNVNAGVPRIRSKWRLVDRNDVARLVGLNLYLTSRPVAGTI